MAKIAQRQVVASITPVKPGGAVHQPPKFEGYFAQVSGGEVTASVEKVYDGGSLFPQVLAAPPEIGDVTITRHYDSLKDGENLKEVRGLVGQVFYDLTIYDLNADLKVIGSERSFSEALLVGLSEPEGDSSSGAPTTFSMTFSISSVSGKTGAVNRQ
jgi:hypothetical protein